VYTNVQAHICARKECVLKIAMLFSNPFPPKEGQGNYIYNLSKELIKRGHSVHVITRGTKAREFEFDGLNVHVLPFIKVYPFHVDVHGIFVRRFMKVLDKKMDIVHVHTPLPPAVSLQHAHVVSTFHSTLCGGSYRIELVDLHAIIERSLGILFKRNEIALIRCSDVLTVSSRSVAFEMARYYNINPSDIVILGNAVDNTFLERCCSSENQESDTIIYVGRLAYGKGLLDLIDSMKLIVAKRPNSKLVIIGKGPLLRRLIGRTNKLCLRNNVEFRGFVSHSELPFQYTRASVFVMPSYYEGMPTAILEAMACGLPVVATSVHGNVDVVKNGITGILVPPKKPVELARAILYLFDHPDLRYELGKRAQILIKERFTWDKVARRTLDAYDVSKS